MLSLLEEEFPDVCRIVTAMYPSAEDDVITSPYNSVLAMRELTEHADCVLPVENQVSLFFFQKPTGYILNKTLVIFFSFMFSIAFFYSSLWWTS